MPLLSNILKPFLNQYIKSKANKNLPNYNQSLNIDKIAAPVEVLRDKWGVPHIYAENQSDLFFAQGFVHAQDRLWQMEILRRASNGTLCEMLGKNAIEADKMSRSLGFHRLAKKDKAQYTNHPVYSLLERYTEGVNYLLDTCKHLPAEFVLLRHQPQAWTMEDSIAITRLVSLQMAQGWLHEIDRLTLAAKHGYDKAAELFHQYPKQNPISLKNGIETFRKNQSGILEAFKGPFFSPLGGSNNWVIAPHKSETNSAILCNDPHLLINTPNIWFENHLEAPGYKNTGVSLPGAPLVLIGHNENIAWGATLSYADIQDTYIEKFTAASYSQYKHKDRILKANIREEAIYIKKQKQPYTHTVRETIHGPVLLYLEDNQGLTLQSRGLQENNGILGFYELNMAKDWNDFVNACQTLSFPSLNLVYADTNNNIGYYMTGEVPVRQRAKGLLPANGFDGKHEWTGRVPFAEMPHVLNPQQGYFYTCNHKIVSDDFPHDLGNIWMNGYRAQTLEKFLEAKDKFSIKDFQDWQLDFFCPPGAEMAQFFAEWLQAANIQLNKTQQKVIQLLVAWDGQLTANSVGGAIYQVLKQEIIKCWTEDKRSMQGRVSHKELPLLIHSEFFGHDSVALLRLLKEPLSLWWKGDREKMLLEAIDNTYSFLSQKLGGSSANWKWGSLHRMTAPHALSVQKPLDEIFNNGNYPIGGDTDTLCQIAHMPNEEYDGSMVGASYRQIIDMGNLNNSLCMAPVGQSGNSQSPHYADQMPLWVKGEYKPMLWNKTQIEQQAKYKMTMKPK